jgi:hypothetical protein
MTTEPRSVNDGSLLVGVKATPSGWPTASLDPDSGDRRRARSGARRVYKPQKLVFTVSGDCPNGIHPVPRRRLNDSTLVHSVIGPDVSIVSLAASSLNS